MPTTLNNYHMDFTTWRLDDRATLAKEFGWELTTDPVDGPSISTSLSYNQLSTGEQAVLKFLQSPQLPVDLTKFDKKLGGQILELCYQFWKEVKGF